MSRGVPLILILILLAGVATAQDAYHRAVREARVLCDCRQRRGDPYREDCETLFRKLEGLTRPRGAPVSSSLPR